MHIKNHFTTAIKFHFR